MKGRDPTYITLDGHAVDLQSLTPDESEFFERLHTAWTSKMIRRPYIALFYSDENPILEPGRRVTAAVMAHPLFKAGRDLEDRIMLRAGQLRPAPGDLVDVDPFSDEFLTVEEVAEVKGTTRTAVYFAIDRGDVIATDERPRRISKASLRGWTPDPAAQRSGTIRQAKGGLKAS